MTAVITAMDTETLGLQIGAPIWEFAAVRREPDGTQSTEEFFIAHSDEDRDRFLSSLPPKFQADYLKRFDAKTALDQEEACERIVAITDGAHILGAVPSFDTVRIETMLAQHLMVPSWHYHLIDIENVVAGYILGSAPNGTVGARRRELALPPHNSNELSRAVGVNPDDYFRHSAMGDVLWTLAQWDAVVGRRE